MANKKDGLTKAMLLAAGLGTRLKPWTDRHPKALAVVNGKPLLQRNIEYLQQFGIDEVIVNVHHFADQIIEAIEGNNGWGSHIRISDETDEVLETGGGLLKAASLLGDSSAFLLMNTDILTDLDLNAMFQQHQQTKPLATLATTQRQTSRYFLFDDTDTLRGWKNVKTGEQKPLDITVPVTQRAFSGIHIIEPAIFSLINRTGRFSIVDAYLDLMSTQTIKAFDHSNSHFIDVGKHESIAKAEVLFR